MPPKKRPAAAPALRAPSAKSARVKPPGRSPGRPPKPAPAGKALGRPPVKPGRFAGRIRAKKKDASAVVATATPKAPAPTPAGVVKSSAKRRAKGAKRRGRAAAFQRSEFLAGEEFPVRESSGKVILPGDLVACRAYDNNGQDVGPLIAKVQGSPIWASEPQVDDCGFLVPCEIIGIKDQSQAEVLRQQGGQVGAGPCHFCTAWNCRKDIQGWHLGSVKWQDPSQVDSLPWGRNVLAGVRAGRTKDLDPLRKLAGRLGFGGVAPPPAPAAPDPAGAPPVPAALPPVMGPAGVPPGAPPARLEAPAAISPAIRRSKDVTLFFAKQAVLGAALTDSRAKQARKSGPEKKKKKKKKKKKSSSSSSTSESSPSDASGDHNSLVKMLTKEETSVAELARKHPGMLTARAAQNSAEQLDLNYADAAEETYLRPVFQRWTREKSGLPEAGPRAEREALTLARTLDFLIQGRVAEASDVLVQRMKALSLNQRTQEWGVPNSLELINLSEGQLVTPGEARASARDHRAHARLLAIGKPKPRRPLPPREGEKGVTWKERSPTPDRGTDTGSGADSRPQRRSALRKGKPPWRGRGGGRPDGKGRGKGKAKN